MEYAFISADAHVNEPPGTFVDRVPAGLKDRAPRILPALDGGEGWSWDGKPPSRGYEISAIGGAMIGDYRKGLKFSEILRGNYDGKAHIEDALRDGVDASVLYPAAANGSYLCPDRELALACFGAYNDWLIDEFCSVDPKRLVPLCQLPVDDGMEVTVSEMKRVAKKGAKGFFMPGCPQKPYQDRYYDPMWAEAQNLGLPVHFHRNHGGRAPVSDQQDEQNAGIIIRFFSPIRPFTNMIFSGVFDRFPDLKLVAAECNFGWMPYWVQEMENEYARYKPYKELGMKKSPKEYVWRNIFATFLEDDAGFAHINDLPQDNILFSSDYPHSVTTWPKSREIFDRLSNGLSAEVKHKLAAGNAARLYNLV